MCHGFVAFLWQIRPIGPVLPVFPTYNGFAVNNLRVDRHLHTVEVVGSNPAVPTNPKGLKISNLESADEGTKERSAIFGALKGALRGIAPTHIRSRLEKPSGNGGPFDD